MKRTRKNELAGKFDIHKQLVERSKKNDSKAQYELYRLYSQSMLNVAYRITGNQQDAEDVLQEAFVAAFRNLSSFRFESTFGAWLKRIVVNRAINKVKSEKIQMEFFDDMSMQFEEKQEEPDYYPGLTVDRIKNAMHILPRGSRMIFSLYLLEGYDHKEIAKILNISESNSKMQYMRAKNKIKNELSQYAYE